MPIFWLKILFQALVHCIKVFTMTNEKWGIIVLKPTLLQLNRRMVVSSNSYKTRTYCICNYLSMYKKSISDISMMKLNRSNIITQYILGTNKISLVKQMLHMEDKINKQYGEHKKNIKKWRMIKPEHPNQATFLRFHWKKGGRY